MNKRRAILMKYPKARIIALLAALLFSSDAMADDRQYKIESAYLYNFFNYITWPGYATPKDMQSPVICVYGEDPILPYLHYTRGKMAAERNLNIRSIADEASPNGCQILFVRHGISSRALGSLAQNVLVVSKPDDPLDRGGMIELMEDGQRIAIRINQDQLEQNGFQVSSRLLDIARGTR